MKGYVMNGFKRQEVLDIDMFFFSSAAAEGWVDVVEGVAVVQK